MKSSYLKRWFFRILPMLYMYFIWYQSEYYVPEDMRGISTTALEGSTLGGMLENAHYVMFGILYILLILAALTFGRLTSRKETICVWIALLYAVSDEIHQHFVPYRSMSLEDFVKDAVGIAAAWLLIRIVYYRLPDSLPGEWMRRLHSDKKIH